MEIQASGSKKERRVLSEINVTPFVDVMLVLLIIFMVTAPMMQQGIDIELPATKSSGLAIPDEPFILTLKKTKQIFIAETEVPLSRLGAKAVAILKARKEQQIYIQADKSVEYGFVAEVLAEMRSAGLYQVSLITKSHD